MGRPKKLNKSKEFIVNIEEDDWKKLKVICLKKEVSVSAYLRGLIKKTINGEIDIEHIKIITEKVFVKKPKKEKSTTTIKDLIYQQNWLDK